MRNTKKSASDSFGETRRSGLGRECPETAPGPATPLRGRVVTPLGVSKAHAMVSNAWRRLCSCRRFPVDYHHYQPRRLPESLKALSAHDPARTLVRVSSRNANTVLPPPPLACRRAAAADLADVAGGDPCSRVRRRRRDRTVARQPRRTRCARGRTARAARSHRAYIPKRSRALPALAGDRERQGSR